MNAMASQVTGVSLFTQSFVQAQIKENIKALRHWSCEDNSPVTGKFPATRASNAEKVSIWWRHRGLPSLSQIDDAGANSKPVARDIT